MIPLAVFGSVVIGIVLLIFVNRKSHTQPYIAVVRCTDQKAEKEAGKYLASEVEKCVVKSKTVTRGNIKINYEIRLKDEHTDFLNQMFVLEGVENVVLVSYNGDYMG